MENGSINNLNLSEKIERLVNSYSLIYQLIRFAAVGVLNTACNFLILNALSKALNIQSGPSLGIIGAVAFAVAVTQSYFWNSTWTFGSGSDTSVSLNLLRIALIALLGLLPLVIIFFVSKDSAGWKIYAVVGSFYFILEAFLWKIFGFSFSKTYYNRHSFWAFAVVSLAGLLVYTVLLSLISRYFIFTHSDLDKNIAAGVATLLSLLWNFIGYRLIAFK